MRKKLKLEEYEVVCDKCLGHGYFKYIRRNVRGMDPCPKCFGAGKLDWVENIVGKRRPSPLTFKAGWSFSNAQDIKVLHGIDPEAEIVSAMAKELAKQIDREILKELM